MDDLSIYDILYVYESEISKGVKHKKKLVIFERHKMEHIINIYNRLKNRDYKIKKYVNVDEILDNYKQMF